MYKRELDFNELQQKLTDKIYKFIHPTETLAKDLDKRVDKLRKDVDCKMKAEVMKLEHDLREAIGHGDGPGASGTIKHQAFMMIELELNRMNAEVTENIKKNAEISANNARMVEELKEKLESWTDLQDINGRKIDEMNTENTKFFQVIN